MKYGKSYGDLNSISLYRTPEVEWLWVDVIEIAGSYISAITDEIIDRFNKDSNYSNVPEFMRCYNEAREDKWNQFPPVKMSIDEATCLLYALKLVVDSDGSGCAQYIIEYIETGIDDGKTIYIETDL